MISFLKSLRRLFVSRILYLFLALSVQILIIVYLSFNAGTYFRIVNTIIRILAIILVIYLVNKHSNPAYTLIWCITICTFPVLGFIAYILLGEKKVNSQLQKNQLKQLINKQAILIQDSSLEKAFSSQDVKMQYDYLKNVYYPYYHNTDSKYYASGEAFYADYLTDLKKAKHFIFLEFFIIKKGKMWNETWEILQAKVKEGVKVYFIYDDFGGVTDFSEAFCKKANEMGIKMLSFNRLTPRLLVTMNNRDHRKLVIIDNQIGYTGGCNLADEYINEINRFGHWHDSMIRITGDAVWNMTVMFIQFFNAESKQEQLAFHEFKYPNTTVINSALVLPFSDSPSDEENAARNVHLNMINHAKKYLYICTPYLIIDYTIESALINAAKQGVDIRIITPGIPDKKYVFAITRSNYSSLIKNGIKIYEYTPGFIHTKDFICDDEIALVGTINMDYRSYYMHFEDGVLINDQKTIATIKQAYEDTLAVSKLVSYQDCVKISPIRKIFQSMMNLLSPLM